MFHDPEALVSQDLDEANSRRYEELAVESLRQALRPGAGLVVIDAVELVGRRPNTLVVFRYHHRSDYVGRHPGLVSGPLEEAARFWEFAIDEDEYAQGMMDPPAVLAAAIGSALSSRD